MLRFLKIGGYTASALYLPVLLCFAEPESLSLSQALERSQSENPSLRAAQTLVEQAQARYRGAGRWENPELQLEYSSDRSFNDEGERSYRIGFQQQFPITNRLRQEKRIARESIRLAEAEIANQARLLKQRVVSTYLKTAALQAQIELGEKILRSYDDFATFMESRIETGEASQIEVNQIRIEYSATEQELQRLENQWLQQQAQLRQSIGMKEPKTLDVEFEFRLPKSMPEMAERDPSAREEHPAYRMHALMYEIAEQETSLAQSQRWADPSLQVSYQEARSVDAPTGLERERMIGIGISVPLPLINNGQTTVDAQRARRTQRWHQFQSARLELKNEAQLQRQQAQKLYQQAQSYDSGLAQLISQNLRDLKNAYAAGQISLTELFRAQQQSYKMQSTQLSILHDYHQAIIDWKSATATFTSGESKNTTF